MAEPPSKEQLDAIRMRQAAVIAATEKEDEARNALRDDEAAAQKHYALASAEFDWEEARREQEAFADEDIAALLAHIDALEAEITTLREAVRNLGGDPNQAWYWTDAWQAKEREADEDLRAGRYADADDIDTLLAD